jgi:Aldo/keto reductase family
MKSLPRRRLGKTSVQPSAIGMGTGASGGFGVAVDYPLFEQTILAAYGSGVRYFDTAPMYGYGKSEHYLGHAIRTLGLRKEITLSTRWVGFSGQPVDHPRRPRPMASAGSTLCHFATRSIIPTTESCGRLKTVSSGLALIISTFSSSTILAEPGMATPPPSTGSNCVRAAVIGRLKSYGAPGRPALSDLASTKHNPYWTRRRNSHSTVR